MKESRKAALIRGDDRKENIRKCLELIKGDLNSIKQARHILIKPNLVALEPDYANTNVKAIEAVIEFILEFCGDKEKRISVGECGATAFYRGIPTTKVFEDYGFLWNGVWWTPDPMHFEAGKTWRPSKLIRYTR